MSRYGDIKYGNTGFEGGGRKNIIINGDMSIVQRGTSSTGIGESSGYFTCDRWLFGRELSTQQGRFTQTQDTASIGASDLPFTEAGIKTALKMDVTTAESSVAAGESHYMMQRIEGNNCSHFDIVNEPITVSFYAKSDAKTGTMCCSLYASAGGRAHVKEYSITTSWQRYVLVFPPDSGGSAIARDETNALQIMFPLSSGTNFHISADTWASGFDNATSNQINFVDNTNNNFYLTGVQIEKGPTVTAFEHEDFYSKLERCKRYFHRRVAGSPFQRFAIGQCFSDGNDDVLFPNYFHPEMRDIPTLGTGTLSHLGVSDNDADLTARAIDSALAIDTNTDGKQGADVRASDINGNPMSTGAMSFLIANNNANAFIEFDAEL